MSDIFDKIVKNLQKEYSKFKVLKEDPFEFRERCKKIFIDHYKKHDPENKTRISGNKYPFVIVSIKDNKVSSYHPDVDKKEERQFYNLKLIKRTVEYCIKNNKKVPDTHLFFWVSDRVPWELGELMDKYPFYVYAKPKDINNIIFPDNTFECITLKKKYEGECFDWDTIKSMFAKINKSYMEKLNLVYFKGTATTKTIHRIREILEKYSRNKKHFTIFLDGWKKYEPITEIAKYRYLLNLPGHYPWSNRFKYLFLTQSVIFNINVFTKAITEDGWNEEEYLSFMDLIMEPDVDYFDLKFTYYNVGINKSIQLQNKARIMTEKEINKIITKINDIYFNPTKYKDKIESMIKSYNKKIEKLDLEFIYEYIYQCILLNSKIIKG